MKAKCVGAIAAMIAGAGWCAAAETAIFDRNGRMTSMFYSGDEVALRGRVQIPSRDGNRAAEPVAAARGGGRAGGQNVITTEGGTARVRQTVSEEGGRTWIDLQVTADADLDIPGVYYTFDLPRTDFTGGQADVQTGSARKLVSFPVRKATTREFFTGEGSEIAFMGAHNLNFTVSLDRDAAGRVGRPVGPHGRTAVHGGNPDARRKAGGIANRFDEDWTLAARGTPDRTLARLTMDTATRRYQFRGCRRELLLQHRVARFAVHAEQPEGGVGPDGDEPQPLGAGRTQPTCRRISRTSSSRSRCFRACGWRCRWAGSYRTKGFLTSPASGRSRSGRTPTRFAQPQRRGRRHIAPEKMDALVSPSARICSTPGAVRRGAGSVLVQRSQYRRRRYC